MYNNHKEGWIVPVLLIACMLLKIGSVVTLYVVYTHHSVVFDQ